MNRFPLPLKVELQSDRKRWRLLAPFSYLDSEHGRVDVPAGFETDFASVPRLPLTYALLGAYGHAAAVLHDYLYTSGALSRSKADRVFRNALRSSGIARWRAWLMWSGVRVGGRNRFEVAA
ncbi:DUF1353 domain-containing protein [Pseudomonas kuykendallii]|uniref:DUF1353 domain-containing protein n=1 Tax=Pseudomonas kuykendallii TaxID=1007099 RepID=A0A1H3EHY0_9PSED|nr:DUF1353 domain-containing protein [Pseudomonas kuykendallii]MCQ4271089.1 DUF1353 domain-containing protein [Pseudomonas kuykendallii]SDX78362.1 Protein of unknown function [Pseudomonas kuykendallii]